jgi:hypothetical protein
MHFALLPWGVESAIKHRCGDFTMFAFETVPARFTRIEWHEPTYHRNPCAYRGKKGKAIQSNAPIS